MRLVRIAGADLSLFDFDYDLTWYAFFLSPEEAVLGRYGGRDAASDEGRLSLAGLKYAAERALVRFAAEKDAPPPPRGKPVRVEDMPAAQRAKGCIHCHQVNEFRRAERQAAGAWSRDQLWVYPLPENVGLTLDVDRGDLIRSVREGSPAARAGLKPGDLLTRLNGYSIASFADAQYALHRGPKTGSIPVEWQSGTERRRGALEVVEGWRKTNLTWRPSLLDILPSLPVSGENLTPDEKKKLGLPERAAAFRQDKFVHSSLKAIGLMKDDIIYALNGRPVDGTMEDFLGHVRREYLVGDRVTLNVIRAGQKLELPLTLK